jgi:hypothetical protein
MPVEHCIESSFARHHIELFAENPQFPFKDLVKMQPFFLRLEEKAADSAGSTAGRPTMHRARKWLARVREPRPRRSGP